MENKYGRISELKIEAGEKRNETVLKNVYFTPPFKIMKPFYEGGLMKILQMSASPGIMEGDRQNINISIDENACCEIYSQSYEKIHNTGRGQGERNINIELESNCFLAYNPLPVIPYKNSAFENKGVVRLRDKSSVLVYSDIITAGRIASGEEFEYRYYKSLVEIYEGNELKYRDNAIYDNCKMNMRGIGLFEGYTHLLSMALCNINIENQICEIFKNYEYPWGVSNVCENYTGVRVFGRRGEELKEISEKISNLAFKKYNENKRIK